ncbi:MAG: sugar phosphate isomerase/epimerase [Candidatus Brocadiae bacterium]|nr:sugar phosphate isomerase/epimerase [Candidatus Brocadiia bacterium]
MRTLMLPVALLVVGQMAAGEQPAGRNPFFALCMDTHDAKKRTVEQQAAMLKELGYDGCAHLWCTGVTERLKTLDARGLKLSQIYVRVNVAPGKRPYDPQLKEVVKLLKGRETILGLLVTGGKPSDVKLDDRAVTVIREIAGFAAEQGVKVALYPHTNDWLERVGDAVRVVKKVDRKNVGAMFNLCHWLKVGGDEAKLEAVLKDAMPHLFVVTINGADSGLGRQGGWDRLIQPLGSGSFDMGKVLAILRRLDYRGPIGLQCYGIGGDAREHLARSMVAWRALCTRSGVKP